MISLLPTIFQLCPFSLGSFCLPSTARKEGRMSSCKRATEARVGPKLKDSAATMNNPINSRSGKMCSCGKMCKNNRGLKIHQEKTKCQTPENKLVAPPQKCVVSLQNVILSSCLTFDDNVYYRTSDNTFIPISNSEKPVAGNKCTNKRHNYSSFD